MKKVFSILLIVMFVFSMNIAFAADDSDTIDINLDVNAGIAIDCGDNSVTMNAIIQDGQSTIDSTNEQSCNVRTNESHGYSLAVKAVGTNGTDLTNGDNDDIATLTSSASVPATWANAAAASAWGYRLKSDSDSFTGTYATAWGATDGYGGKFLAASGSDVIVGSYATETTDAGNDENFQFGAEIGTDKIQPTGTYTGQVTVTATTL